MELWTGGEGYKMAIGRAALGSGLQGRDRDSVHGAVPHPIAAQASHHLGGDLSAGPGNPAEVPAKKVPPRSRERSEEAHACPLEHRFSWMCTHTHVV